MKGYGPAVGDNMYASLRTLIPRIFLFGALLPTLTGAGLVHTTFNGWRSVTVPGTGPLPEGIPDLSQYPELKLDPRIMDVTLGEALEGVNIRYGDVVEAHISDFTVEATGDLGFMSAVEVWLIHGVTRERLASRYAFVEGTQKVVMSVDDVDLAPFLTEPDTVIAVIGNGLPPEDATDLVARYTIRFGLSAKGACYALSVAKDYKDAAASDTAEP